jgi:two-component system response regulator YesN
MTDIKMPGLSGLELIQKIRKVHSDVEFIILSGYGEFEFAREAMQYGVHHYLLKPCNEEQIMQSVRETIDEISQKRMSKISPVDTSRQHMESTMILNIFNEYVAYEVASSKFEENDVYRPYEKFMDFYRIPYELYYIYFLNMDSVPDAIHQLDLFHNTQAPGIVFHILYVRQTMLIFFPSYRLRYEELDTFIEHLTLPHQQITIQYKHEHFDNLKVLLNCVIPKLKRYETIYYNENGIMVNICNYRNIMYEAENLSNDIYSKDYQISKNAEESLITLLYQISDASFLKQLLSTIIMRAASKCLDYSSIEATEFLLDINALNDTSQIMEKFLPILQLIEQKYSNTKSGGGTLSDTIKTYVSDNLSDSNLSLKWIAENVLYMNVDYVSKKFFKETGTKFSNYLTEIRIQKAKELLLGSDSDKIQDIAEMVGCGNNPQYFSQLFKKTTGMTPSAYIKFISGGK